MGDLKPIWQNPGVPTPDLSGDLPTARGNDPNIDQGGSSGLDPIWQNPGVSLTSEQETPNPVSGLPLHPDRFQPSETPPAPPSLQDRNPGTIDQK